jgi:hypothetical protein
MPRTQDDSSSMPRTRGIGYQFGVHLSHKITPLPPVENFPIVIIGLRCIRRSSAKPGVMAGAKILFSNLYDRPYSALSPSACSLIMPKTE